MRLTIVAIEQTTERSTEFIYQPIASQILFPGLSPSMILLWNSAVSNVNGPVGLWQDQMTNTILCNVTK